jgi:hypothetical protein
MSTARIRIKELGTRAPWGPMPIDLRRSVVVLACMFTVFAGSFEIGHATRSTGSLPPAYGPQELSAGSVRAGIPDGLIATPPIPPLAAAPAPKTAGRSSSRTVVAASSATPVEPASSVLPNRSSPAPAVSSPAPSVSPAPVHSPAPAPAAAPVHASPPVVSQPHGGSSGGGGGGSFDSSG